MAGGPLFFVFWTPPIKGRLERNYTIAQNYPFLRDSIRVSVIVLSFDCLFAKFVNFFVQQIDFSSNKTYNWMKKE